MDRETFDHLLTIPDKRITGDIRLVPRRQLSPALVAEDVRIENSAGLDLRLTVSFNPETGAKSCNVHIPGVGSICRLDVDGPSHRPAGRSHKHAMRTDACPRRNLPDRVIDRPDLSGKDIEYVVAELCRIGNVLHDGSVIRPELS